MEETLFGEKSLIFWTAITFVVLLVMLKKFAYGPILDTLDKRSQRIHDALDEAERLKNEADKMFVDYNEQLENAKKEAQTLIEQGKKMGEVLKQEIVDKAKEQSANMISKAEIEIGNKTNDALKELQKNVAMLSVNVAEKVLKKTMTGEDQKRLLEDSLTEVGRISGSN